MMATSVEMVVEMRISLIVSVFVVFILLAFLRFGLEPLAQIVRCYGTDAVCRHHHDEVSYPRGCPRLRMSFYVWEPA